MFNSFFVFVRTTTLSFCLGLSYFYGNEIADNVQKNEILFRAFLLLLLRCQFYLACYILVI